MQTVQRALEIVIKMAGGNEEKGKGDESAGADTDQESTMIDLWVL